MKCRLLERPQVGRYGPPARGPDASGGPVFRHPGKPEARELTGAAPLTRPPNLILRLIMIEHASESSSDPSQWPDSRMIRRSGPGPERVLHCANLFKCPGRCGRCGIGCRPGRHPGPIRVMGAGDSDPPWRGYGAGGPGDERHRAPTVNLRYHNEVRRKAMPRHAGDFTTESTHVLLHWESCLQGSVIPATEPARAVSDIRPEQPVRHARLFGGTRKRTP